MSTTHAAVVVVADDGTSPVGTDEWNATHVEAGLAQSDRTLAADETIAAGRAAVVPWGLSIATGIRLSIAADAVLALI